MTTLREAAQQALEALELMVVDVKTTPTAYEAQRQAIAAIRAALAEPEEPVAQRGAMFRTHPAVELQRSVESAVRPACGVDPAAKAQPAQEPDSPERRCGGPGCDGTCCQPVQEPVAWMYTGIKSDGSKHGPHLVWKPAYMDAMSASKGAQATPLYAHPPQRPAEPVQEPVCDKDPRGCYSVRCQLGRMCKHAAQPQRKPMTDEQKQAIHNETGAGHSLICLVESYINGIK